MTAFRRAKEPAVINLSLIKLAIEEEERTHHSLETDTGSYTPTSPSQSLKLRLSFRKLQKIENLLPLRAILELRLDNNNISKIEGVGHLKNLRLLDLSFNKIKTIENMNFAQLAELSLFNNEIKAIECLDDCPKLQCLSLGNNYIPELQQILRLRKHKELRSLSLDGNPMCGASKNGYRYFCLAFLPQLKYLDAQLITLSEMQAAREGGVSAELLAAVEEKEVNEAKAAEKDITRRATIEKLASGNLDVAATLFEDMFFDDSEYSRWQNMHGVSQAMEDFKTAAKNAADELAAAGMEKSKAIEVRDPATRTSTRCTQA